MHHQVPDEDVAAESLGCSDQESLNSLLVLIEVVCKSNLCSAGIDNSIRQLVALIESKRQVLESNQNLQKCLCEQLEKMETKKDEGIFCLLKASGLVELFGPGLRVKISRIMDRLNVRHFNVKLNKDSTLDSQYYKSAMLLKKSNFLQVPFFLFSESDVVERFFSNILNKTGVFVVQNDIGSTSILLNQSDRIYRVNKVLSSFDVSISLTKCYLRELTLRLAIDGYLGYSPLVISSGRTTQTFNLVKSVFSELKVIIASDQSETAYAENSIISNSESIQTCVSDVQHNPLQEIKTIASFIDKTLIPQEIDLLDQSLFEHPLGFDDTNVREIE